MDLGPEHQRCRDPRLALAEEVGWDVTEVFLLVRICLPSIAVRVLRCSQRRWQRSGNPSIGVSS